MDFDLTGDILISTPAMADPRFEHSVIFLCAHSSEGAFGLVLNRPMTQPTMASVLDQVGVEDHGKLASTPVMLGGPVETQRGFVLHAGSADDDPSGQEIGEGLVLSASTEILKVIAEGKGPKDWLLMLGYSGWGPGQLEAEIAQNAWLTCKAPQSLIFDPKPGEHQWLDALKSMGVDPVSLSSISGRA
ncbi:YqgE/AlgH family protein [Pararhodobacter oceanensis]|uniref:UPF0301 protein DDE20_02730 n=1 Tax=Pararhodobacter oceanensis TaxID=2172121 RepID=A0A2T8HYR0_9RHOB|nr:YqgE/AlgH family protein [Pararhodobacter oceanensis]PVH30472.1 hypothetical protein DDE20_02730 [Pararhodobacter oceanensis]